MKTFNLSGSTTSNDAVEREREKKNHDERMGWLWVTVPYEGDTLAIHSDTVLHLVPFDDRDDVLRYLQQTSRLTLGFHGKDLYLDRMVERRTREQLRHSHNHSSFHRIPFLAALGQEYLPCAVDTQAILPVLPTL